MCIGIRLPVISSFSFQLSRGFYAIFFVPFPSSDHFLIMCANDYAIIKWSEAQFRLRRSGTVALPTPLASSTSAPSPFTSGMTLEDIMVQL